MHRDMSLDTHPIVGSGVITEIAHYSVRASVLRILIFSDARLSNIWRKYEKSMVLLKLGKIHEMMKIINKQGITRCGTGHG